MSAESPIFFPKKAVEGVLGAEFKAVSPSQRTSRRWIVTGERAEVELEMINKCTLGVTVTSRNAQEGRRSSALILQIDSPLVFNDGKVIFSDDTQSVIISKEKVVFRPDW